MTAKKEHIGINCLDPHNNGIGDGDDDDDDDEFFGSQDDCNMAIHELNAKNNEIKNIGFLNAYDEFKESRLQEGFEKGYLESFEIGKMIGKMIGEITTLEKANANEIRLLENVSSTISTTATQQSPNNNLVDVQPRKKNIKVTEIVHDFFTNKFQNDKQDPSNVVQDLENLKQELKNLQHMNNGPC